VTLKLSRQLFICLLVFTGVLFSTICLSQETAIVYGTITDIKGKPLLGVNIAVMGQPGGTASAANGTFELVVPANKNIDLMFSFIGYATAKKSINLPAGSRNQFDHVMETSATPLPSVEIKDEKDRRGTFIRIDPKTVNQIPNVSGSFEAILKTIGMGVVSNNELSSQYSVRGGNFDENLVYVNDVEIYRPFLVRSGQQEGLSFINSDMVSAISFSAGGFEANYGDKMSSVLDIKYRKPTTFGGSFYASLLGGGLHLEGATKKKDLTFMIGGRYKSSQYLFKSLETKGEYKPVFSDVQGQLTYAFSKKTDLSFLGSY